MRDASLPAGCSLYRVKFPDGLRDLLSFIPQESAFEAGLAPETVIGTCGESTFHPNKPFVDLLHNVIATYGPAVPALQDAARQQGSGFVYVIDGRTPTPGDAVPPCDILGAFEVSDGTVVPDSYQSNPNHVLFSERGLFQLEEVLHERLMERLQQVQAAHRRQSSARSQLTLIQR